MQTPLYTRYEFVDATAFTTASAQESANVALLAAAGLRPGLIRGDVVSFSSASLVLTASMPAPFAIIQATGVIAGAHGTVTNADTQTANVNLAPFVPGSGSALVYILASGVAIQQNPYQVIGPPEGHPSYDPGFLPFTAYATLVDSLAVYASGGPANNITTFELGRTTLAVGATSIPPIDDTHQVYATAQPYENTIGVTANKALALTDAGIAQRADAAGLFFTLPDAAVAVNQVFTIVARAASATLQQSTGSNLIYGVTTTPGVGVPSAVIAQGNMVTVQSDGANWQVIAASLGTTANRVATVNVAGAANVTLTGSQAAANVIILTGALTANIDVIFPTTATGLYSIQRATTGTFFPTATSAGGGTSVGLSAGTQMVYSDGANIVSAAQNSITQSAGNSTTLNATTAFATGADATVLSTAETFATNAANAAQAAAISTSETFATNADTAVLTYVNTNFLPLTGGVLSNQVRFTAFTAVATGGVFGGNGVSGAVIGGIGSATDVIILNRSNGAVAQVTAGDTLLSSSVGVPNADNSQHFSTTNWVRNNMDAAGSASAAQTNAQNFATAGDNAVRASSAQRASNLADLGSISGALGVLGFTGSPGVTSITIPNNGANALVIKWGQGLSTGNGNIDTFNFSSAFPNGSLLVMAQYIATAVPSAGAIGGLNLSNAQFRIQDTAAGAHGFYYIALGF